jgi:hypothetical protein
MGFLWGILQATENLKELGVGWTKIKMILKENAGRASSVLIWFMIWTNEGLL